MKKNTPKFVMEWNNFELWFLKDLFLKNLKIGQNNSIKIKTENCLKKSH